MRERFSAFTFVDRITDVAPGTRVRGTFHIPAGIREFPAALVAEAVGQLAAWASMAHLRFQRRPVAGLARETRFLGVVRPGDTLELAAELESCTNDDVAYAGSAAVDGKPVIALDQCLGPMLPVEEFDAPEALRRDYEVLCGAGAPADRFAGLPEFEVKCTESIPGERIKATLRVPESAAFFQDHFPRRPVFPATLLLDNQIRLALRLAREAMALPESAHLAAARVLDVKVRTFISPGQVLEIAAERVAVESGPLTARLSARANGKPVAAARVEIGAQRGERA
jgi:3-hydroxymyristoyl/3-hydroxydecanoyl-(acyl carrier protein) dehydratase